MQRQICQELLESGSWMSNLERSLTVNVADTDDMTDLLQDMFHDRMYERITPEMHDILCDILADRQAKQPPTL